jgi:hypothetical protein
VSGDLADGLERNDLEHSRFLRLSPTQHAFLAWPGLAWSRSIPTMA